MKATSIVDLPVALGRMIPRLYPYRGFFKGVKR
jgi:hypothetical protein